MLEQSKHLLSKIFSSNVNVDVKVKITPLDKEKVEIDSTSIYVENDSGESVIYSHSEENGSIFNLVSFDKEFDGKAIEYRVTKKYFLDNFSISFKNCFNKDLSVALS